MNPARALKDLRPFKTRIQNLLPPGHPVREAFLREPDWLPEDVARIKAETYALMLVDMR